MYTSAVHFSLDGRSMASGLLIGSTSYTTTGCDSEAERRGEHFWSDTCRRRDVGLELKQTK